METFKHSREVKGRSEEGQRASRRLYLVGHLVGPHGHLLHRHVCHVAAVLAGGSPRGTELDFLWPARDECTGQRSDRQTPHMTTSRDGEGLNGPRDGR